jgi:transcriptional regulator with GAF, ATPase, and Fis domain
MPPRNIAASGRPKYRPVSADISANTDVISSRSAYDSIMAKKNNNISVDQRFLALLTDISALLVGARSDGIYEAVDQSLEMVGDFFGAIVVGLGTWSDSGVILGTLRAWGPNPVGDYLAAIPPGEEVATEILRKGSVTWNCLEDLEGLPQFQEHVRQVNVMAGSIWLHRHFASHQEHLAIGRLDPVPWPEDTLKYQAAIGTVLYNALYRRRAEAAAEQLRRLELIVSDIATRMVCIRNANIDAEINNALAQIGETTGADLCLFLRNKNQNTSIFEVNHEWIVDAEGGSQFAGVSLADDYPWLVKQLEKKKSLRLSNPDDFVLEASAEFELFERTGIQTLVLEPFTAADESYGYLGLGSVDRKRQWSDGTFTQLGLCGNIIAEAIAHQRAHFDLEQAFVEIQALKNKLVVENETLRQEVEILYADDELIGKSHVFRAAIFQAEQVAPTDSTVLLLGETGTGKGLIARRIHELSERNERPMITVNCAALPSSLIESELFGHEKGAFTGAIAQKVGRFELADGGTIFLDEVGDLPTELQAKLLRVLQDQEFERVGSSTTRTVDARVIAATNRDLDQLIRQGEFRADLYYRLGVFPIRAPALRERRSDIPLLIWFFISELQHRLGKEFNEVSAQTMAVLSEYDWPGNVRELKNIIERAMILSPGSVLQLGNWFSSEHDVNVVSFRPHDGAGETIEEVERAHIEKVLAECDWKIRGKGGAAEHLGLKRTTLQSRMKKLGIERPRA